MPRYRESEYSIYPRELNNKTVWYYYIYENGRRVSRSTGIGYTRERDRVKSRREAEAYCEERARAGDLGGSPGQTLGDWIEQLRFWDWNRSPYIRGILARSTKEKPGITEGYCRDAASITKRVIIPYHGHKSIESITALDCEDLLFTWQDLTANKTVNNWKSIYSTMLGEYERIQLMKDPRSTYRNPWRMVKPLGVEKKQFGAISVNEAALIMAPDGIDGQRDRIYYHAMKLAFLAGLRIGEVCGLYTDDVRDSEIMAGDKKVRLSYLEVKYQYNMQLKKRTLVKDKDVRMIPITPQLREELQQFLTGPGRYVFSFHPRQETPITGNRLREWMYRRMDGIGIDKEARQARNIAFHSTRRFFNTLLRRAKVGDDIIRKFTGHDSEEMTEHYTDYLPEDMQHISTAQKLLIEGKLEE
jgi:integrase